MGDQGHLLIKEPDLNIPENTSINKIVDLGGGSGTIYQRVDRSVTNTFGIVFELPFKSTDKLSKTIAPNKILDLHKEEETEAITTQLFEELTKELESADM